MKKHLPSLLTSLNLLCGCIAVVMAFGNRLEWAAWLVFVALVFDLFDGMVARMFNAFSEFGKQLDSLADMVSFGLVPGVIMYKLFQMPFNHLLEGEGVFPMILAFTPFLITIFSALRLAKFNIDERQHESFIGLATPANALLTISWALIMLKGPAQFADVILNPYVLLFFILTQSYLLVAEIPMFSFKLKSFSWSGNEIRYVFLGTCVLLLSVFTWAGYSYASIPLIIVFYVLLSLLTNPKKK